MTTTLVPAPYRVRPITPQDRASLTRFYAGLSPDSKVNRFHGTAPTIPDATATFFCGPDHQHREGIVAESFDSICDPVIIGHVCVEPIGDGIAEIAVAVTDAWQQHGVGRAMFVNAITWAQTHGIAGLSASIRSANTAMFALLQSTRYPMGCGPSVSGTVDAHLDLRSSRVIAA